jgi:hypothetical protein
MFIIEASFDCELYAQLQEIEDQVKKLQEIEDKVKESQDAIDLIDIEGKRLENGDSYKTTEVTNIPHTPPGFALNSPLHDHNGMRDRNLTPLSSSGYSSSGTCKCIYICMHSCV